MIVSCPACKYEYEVESGKYQCGICGVKFFAFRNGLVELAANSPVPALPPAGNAKKRFQAGELILGHYRVIAASAPDAKEVIYKCLDENTNQEVSLKDLFPDVAIADVSSARFQKIDTPVVAAAPVAPVAAAPVAPAPVAPVAPAPVMPVNAGFNFQMLKISNIIILASAVVALASLFTPWVEVLEAVMGMKFWQCWLFWGIGWAVPVASVIVSKKGNALVSVVCGLVGIGFALVFYSETQFSFLGRTVDTSSFGIWIYLVASLALIGGGVVCALGKSSAGLVAGFVYDVKNIKNIFAKGK